MMEMKFRKIVLSASCLFCHASDGCFILKNQCSEQGLKVSKFLWQHNNDISSPPFILLTCINLNPSMDNESLMMAQLSGLKFLARHYNDSSKTI